MNRRSITNQAPAQSPPSVARKIREAYAAHQAGELDKAERLYAAVLRNRPSEFDALHMFGLLNYQRGRYTEALRLISAALKSNGKSADAWSNLGLVFHAQGEHAQALTSYDESLTIRPAHAEVLSNRGNTLNRLGKHDAALESFAQAISAKPDFLPAYYNRGTTLLSLGRFEEALASFDAALDHAPYHAETLCHRGNALLKLNRVDDALSSYALALKSSPDNPVILHNQAHALRLQGRPRDALGSAERALAVNPDYASARFEQSLALLTLGELRDGFAAYQSRWETEHFALQRRNFTAPLWLGQEADNNGSLAGKTILLHAEQGFGDTLQFVRYVPLIAQRGANVVLETQPQLKFLMSRITGASLVVARGETLPPFDLHCPLMSLPHAMKTDLATIPAKVPYLTAEPKRIVHWADRLAAYAGKIKIGLVWAGDSRKHDPIANAIDRRRSITLQHLAPLTEITGVQFFSLQKGEPASQALHPPQGMALFDMTADLRDFEDTAALIANLDLVISVDTAVAHLAGALAKPVWVLSRFDGCWRWLNGREDSPWYPTMRLFHQKTPGAWDEVIARVRAKLVREIGNTPPEK